MQPGTTRAADRFMRVNTYIDMVVRSDDRSIAAAAAISVIRNASVPYGIITADAPNLSIARWRIVAVLPCLPILDHSKPGLSAVVTAADGSMKRFLGIL